MQMFRVIAATMVTVPLLASLSFAQDEKIVVALVGDSTVTDHAGWGKAFADRFDDHVTVLNFAASGRSSKSFYDENRLARVLKAKPDYVLIQFGHNDQPGKGEKRETDPATTYRDYLKIYVTKAREIGAIPILITSVTRRKLDDDGKIKTTLTPYADAVRAVAEAMEVPVIDLHTASVAYHNTLGPEASMTFNPKPHDTTHFNAKGAKAIAELILQELDTADKTLASHVKE